MAITEAQVRATIEVSKDYDITVFMVTAKLIRDEDLAGQGLSTARLDQIEIFLAAHFTAIANERGGLKSTETLNAKDEYFGDYGRGLNSTRYGQQAQILDTSGILAAQAEPVSKAQFRVV